MGIGKEKGVEEGKKGGGRNKQTNKQTNNNQLWSNVQWRVAYLNMLRTTEIPIFECKTTFNAQQYRSTETC